jgi:hypothetical protein
MRATLIVGSPGKTQFHADKDHADGQTVTIGWKRFAVAAPALRPNRIIAASIAAGAIVLALAVALPFSLRGSVMTVQDGLDNDIAARLVGVWNEWKMSEEERPALIALAGGVPARIRSVEFLGGQKFRMDLALHDDGKYTAYEGEYSVQGNKITFTSTRDGRKVQDQAELHGPSFGKYVRFSQLKDGSYIHWRGNNRATAKYTILEVVGVWQIPEGTRQGREAIEGTLTISSDGRCKLATREGGAGNAWKTVAGTCAVQRNTITLRLDKPKPGDEGQGEGAKITPVPAKDQPARPQAASNPNVPEERTMSLRLLEPGWPILAGPISFLRKPELPQDAAANLVGAWMIDDNSSALGNADYPLGLVFEFTPDNRLKLHVQENGKEHVIEGKYSFRDGNIVWSAVENGNTNTVTLPIFKLSETEFVARGVDGGFFKCVKGRSSDYTTVPDLIGKLGREAKEAVAAAGLGFVYPPAADTDEMVSELRDATGRSLKAGQRVRRGSKLLIATDRFNTVPNVVGLDLAEAMNQLKKAKILVKLPVERTPGPHRRENEVLSVEPLKRIPLNAFLEITASPGKGTITINNQAKFAVGVAWSYTRGGEVVSQAPESVMPGTSKDIPIPVDATRLQIELRAQNKMISKKDFDGPVTKTFLVEGNDANNYSIEITPPY